MIELATFLNILKAVCLMYNILKKRGGRLEILSIDQKTRKKLLEPSTEIRWFNRVKSWLVLLIGFAVSAFSLYYQSLFKIEILGVIVATSISVSVAAFFEVGRIDREKEQQRRAEQLEKYETLVQLIKIANLLILKEEILQGIIKTVSTEGFDPSIGVPRISKNFEKLLDRILFEASNSINAETLQIVLVALYNFRNMRESFEVMGREQYRSLKMIIDHIIPEEQLQKAKLVSDSAASKIKEMLPGLEKSSNDMQIAIEEIRSFTEIIEEKL